MFIWFVATAVLGVAIVFRSPAIDFRTVALGAVLPLIEAATGGPRFLHSVVGAVAVLVVVMALTPRRRILRRRLLGIPIGLMAHLVFDGSFASTEIFWWPVAGTDFAAGQIPELKNPGRSLLLELVGIGLALWAWRVFDLADPTRREKLRTTGRLDLPG